MKVDTVVVGAGLAGLQCARLLAHRGIRVALIDQKASVADSVHTTGIFVRKTWEDFPLPDEQLGRPIRRVTLYSPARRALQLDAERDEFRVGRMAWIYLYLLEQCSRAGVTWLPSSRVIGCEPGRVAIERSGRSESIAARFIIGADGPRSLVARQFGLDRNRELLVGLEDVVPSAASEPALHCYLDPRYAPGYIAWIVDDGEEAHIGVAGYRERFRAAEALAAFRATLPEPYASARAIERRGGLIPVNGILGRIANRHALLVGDAAGAVSPLTAGGLDGAMRLSTFAAEVVADYLDRGDSEVLRHYTGHRFRARFVARRWMRRVIRGIGHPLLMELGCALLRTPPLRAVARHVFFGRGSFPNAALNASALSPSSRYEG
jgi:geranylgeranyl reductase family protein